MNKRRTLKIIILIVLAGFLLVNSIYIEKLSERRSQTAGEFNASVYVENFWTDLLSIQNIVDASTLLDLFEQDMPQAILKYGKTLGVSSNHSFLLQGKAAVTAITADAIHVTLQSDKAHELILQTDFIFGNAIRDASGLVRVSDFPSTMEFNEISSEINRHVTSQVLPPFLGAIAIGDVFHFIGATTINQEEPDINPLKIVPITLEILDS